MSGDRKYTPEEHGPRITGFLQRILDNSGLNLKFQITTGSSRHPEIENPDVMVKFEGRDLDILLENKGELLLALEQLTLEALHVPSDAHSLLCFDANDYRMMRMEELRLAAITAAEQVKKSRLPFRFNPMTSRERRVIHLVLRDETTLKSESFGTGPARQVVIYPADQPPPQIQLAPAPPRRPMEHGGGGRDRDRDRGPRERSPRQRGPRPRNT